MDNQQVLKQLESIATEIAQNGQVDFDSSGVGGNILERGLDSLDLVDYLLGIEEKFGIRVSEQDLKDGKLFSTQAMAAFLVQRMERSK